MEGEFSLSEPLRGGSVFSAAPWPGLLGKAAGLSRTAQATENPASRFSFVNRTRRWSTKKTWHRRTGAMRGEFLLEGSTILSLRI